MARLYDLLLGSPGAIVLVFHDGTFAADHMSRALYLGDGALVAAEMHVHAHSHAHFHPAGR